MVSIFNENGMLCFFFRACCVKERNVMLSIVVVKRFQYLEYKVFNSSLVASKNGEGEGLFNGRGEGE